MSTKKISRSKKEGWLTIPEFYSGKSVFITGATGFLGKVLVEKLLRSSPRIEKIYVLMRPKKGKSLEERLAEMIALPLFVKIKREDSSVLKKIIALKGDVYEKNLGLSEEDRKTLTQEVSVVFHVAACVRFDDPLKQAILMNTRGTLEVLLLAKQMKHLESFMHVSTTYCNTHKYIIEEEVYPPPGDWRVLIKLAENMDQHTLEVFAPKILGGYPNTYTFTKGLAEHIVKEFQNEVPALIFRPSIVISSLVEPMPGWVDNFNGPVGLLVASGKGVVKIVYSDPSIRADYVPVDVAVRAMIVTAWQRGMERSDISRLPVYNCSSYGIKSITQKELVDVASYVVQDVPLNDMLWYPTGTVTGCKSYYYLCVLLFHVIPAIAVDFALKMANKKPMLLKIQRKIFVANMALAYFLTKQWSFTNTKLFEIEAEILEKDKPNFSFRVELNFARFYLEWDICMILIKNLRPSAKCIVTRPKPSYLCMNDQELELSVRYCKLWYKLRLNITALTYLWGDLLHDIDVIEYFRNCAYGVREYLLKEDNTELPEAKKRQFKMYWLDRGLKIVLLLFLTLLIYKVNVIPIIKGHVFHLLGTLFNFFFY